MRLLAAFIAGIVLAAAGTAGAGSPHLKDLLTRVGVVEAHQEAQDAQIADLREQVRQARFAADAADRMALWALESATKDAYRLRACGMKPTIRKQNVCFFRLF